MTPDPTPQPAHDHGAAGFCTDHAQAPDERTETVARDGLVDVAYRAWCSARRGKSEAPGEYEALYSRIEAEWMAQVVAAVVAALGKDDAGFWPALAGQNDRDAWAFMAERDAARAALDRARALCAQIEAMPIPADPGMSQTAITERIVATITRAVRAALDSEEPR